MSTPVIFIGESPPPLPWGLMIQLKYQVKQGGYFIQKMSTNNGEINMVVNTMRQIVLPCLLILYLKDTHAIRVSKNLVSFSIVTVSNVRSRDK